MKKNNLKQLAMITLTMLLSYQLMAQGRLTDLEVVGISPAGTVANGGQLPLKFNIINHGPDDEVAGDTTFYLLYRVVDGQKETVYQGALVNRGGVLAGQSSPYADNYGISFNFPGIKAPLTIDFCFKVATEGLLSNGDTFRLSHMDTNRSNNVSCTQVTILPKGTGILDNSADPAFLIYPNPANREVTIRLNEGSYTGGLKVTIRDINGHQVLAQQYKEDELKVGNLFLDVSTLSPGIFMINFQSKTNSVSKKLTIIR